MDRVRWNINLDDGIHRKTIRTLCYNLNDHLKVVEHPERGHVVGGGVQYFLQNLLCVGELWSQERLLHPENYLIKSWQMFHYNNT